MTASAGLHNMPADLRPAVVAEPGHVFVRADLGQIEPRVLAAVSGDRAAGARPRRTTTCTRRSPTQLGVDRPTAKVAVLGAMYGQTTGHGAQALRGLEAAYPVAMALPRGRRPRPARAGVDLRTYGGRLRSGCGSTNADGGERARGTPQRRGARVATAATRWCRARRPSCSRCGPSPSGPAARRSTRASCCACTTSCWCTCRRRTARPRRSCSCDCLQEAAHRWAPG